MSGGGGKGGEQQQSIDPRLSAAAAEALTRAGEASKIPYSPNRGVTIAAFTPQQEAAMKTASDAATAFGLEGGGAPSMPVAETSASGVRGYSTGKDFDEMVNKSLSPTLRAAIDKMFISRDGVSSADKRLDLTKKAGTQLRGTLSEMFRMRPKGQATPAEGK